MKNTVVVTLQNEKQSKDFELPLNVSMIELYYRLQKVLEKTKMVLAGGSQIILEINGAGMIEQGATLSDYGVRDGDILTLADSSKYEWELVDCYS